MRHILNKLERRPGVVFQLILHQPVTAKFFTMLTIRLFEMRFIRYPYYKISANVVDILYKRLIICYKGRPTRAKKIPEN